MKLSATFINATGNTKPFDITEGFTLQDADNVVANDDYESLNEIAEDDK